MQNKNVPIILVAEDDEDDFFFLKRALVEIDWKVNLRHVKDGEELLDYLYGKGSYANGEEAPAPDLILLDLNMPRKSGREALQEIKESRKLNAIPIIVLTTSRAEQDIDNAYCLGVNAFVAKPNDFSFFLKPLREFWFNLAQLPKRGLQDGSKKKTHYCDEWTR